jgi:hypothetical protein
MSVTIRNDGKRARTPRLGMPASRTPRTHGDGDPLFWTDLIQHGPKGDPKKRLERDMRRPRATVLVEHRGVSRAQRREAHGRGWNPGRLVLHRTRWHARSAGVALASPTSVRGERQRGIRRSYLGGGLGFLRKPLKRGGVA